MEKGAYMTKKEVDRVEVFVRLTQRQITKTQASAELGLSIRQVLRLYKAYKEHGISALSSKKRGRASNHQLSASLKKLVSDFVVRDIHTGFRPTFMCEKFSEQYGLKVSKETFRQIMIQRGVWFSRSNKSPVVHQQRVRRSRYGELVQIDGSPHNWFEDRGERCCLLVYIDDATGQTFGKFFEVESSAAYMETTREYIIRFGIPRCFYSDKHGIFRINREGCTKKETVTQFGRALKELGIHLIYANSPQAKGRVERSNQTHQDRLVKELRLAGVSTIDEANKFLEKTKYWERHNRKFAIQPANQENAHKKLPSDGDLDRILCFKETRKISKNLEFQYENVIYQVGFEDRLKSLRGAAITVLKKLNGDIFVEHKGKPVSFRKYCEQIFIGNEVNSKEIDRFLNKKERKPVSPNHPYKRSYNYKRAA
jgi:transposase